MKARAALVGVAFCMVAGCATAPDYPVQVLTPPPSIFDLSERLETGKTSRTEAIALLGDFNAETRLADGTTLLQWTTQWGRQGEVVSVTFDEAGVMRDLTSRSRMMF